MTNKEYKNLYSITMVEFLKDFCQVPNSEEYSGLTHRELDTIFLLTDGFALRRENYRVCHKDHFATGEVINVRDCNGNTAPYINPIYNLDERKIEDNKKARIQREIDMMFEQKEQLILKEAALVDVEKKKDLDAYEQQKNVEKTFDNIIEALEEEIMLGNISFSKNRYYPKPISRVLVKK